ncbi:MAG: hypothetical protein R2778_19105 [Saprospiraceae bacterium]
MKQFCAEQGHPFTIDSSGSFDMGEAAGYFSYIEDPDGTLIEFVETHKIPILKKVSMDGTSICASEAIRKNRFLPGC